MKVTKQVIINVPAGAWTLKPDWPERAIQALETLGYENVDKREGCVMGTRGTATGCSPLPGDGRTRKHVVRVNTEEISYTIETDMSPFTAAAEAVFAAEANSLLLNLAGAPLDLAAVEEADAARVAVDRNVRIGVIVGGIVLFFILIWLSAMM